MKVNRFHYTQKVQSEHLFIFGRNNNYNNNKTTTHTKTTTNNNKQIKTRKNNKQTKTKHTVFQRNAQTNKPRLSFTRCVTQRVQARSRGGRWCWTLNLRDPGEIKRREVVLDPVVRPEEIMNREVELGCENWTFFASSCYSTAVQRTLSL